MTETKPNWRSALRAVVDQKRRELGPHPTLDALAAYHAGQIEPPAAARLQEHLVLCSECSELLLELSAFIADARVEQQPSLAPVVPIAAHRAKRRSWWAAAASTGAAASAAAVALLFVWPRGAPLPEYTLSYDGNVRVVRGAEDPGKKISVAPGHPFTIQLQPRTATDGAEVTARAYRWRDGELRPLSASTLEIDRKGVVSLGGVPGLDLHLPNGKSELVVAVARPAALPSARRLWRQLDRSPEARAERWNGFRQTIELLEPVEQSPGHTEAIQPQPANHLASPATASGKYHQPWIEFSGCRTIMEGPVCVLSDDRRLTLWIRHGPDAEVHIEAGIFFGSGGRTEVQGGYRYQVDVGRWSKELVVEVFHQERRSIWALELEQPGASPDWLAAARERYLGGDVDAARRILEPRLSAADPRERGLALGLLARMEGLGGRPELAEEYYRRALAAHREAGDLYGEVNDATALVWELQGQKRFSEARELLDGLPVDALGGSTMARYLAAYWRGVVAEETGDFRAAMTWMHRAGRAAAHAGLTRKQIMSEDLLARQLHTVGLVDAAAWLQERLRARETELCGDAESALNACDCAGLLNNRAWTQLLNLEADRPAEDPVPVLEDAQRILLTRARESCRSEELPNVRLNLALAALHAGDVDRARELIQAVAVMTRQDQEEPEADPQANTLALWRLDVEARIQLAESRPVAALESYRELAGLAELSSSPEAAWRAAFGRAVALGALGRRDEAIDSCLAAEDLLDQESLLVPMHTGRERFIAQRERAARFCLDLLLRADRVDEALAAARRSAARALSSLRLGASFSDLKDEDRRRWEAAAGSYQTKRAEIEERAARIQRGLPADEEELLTGQIEDRRQELRLQLSEMFSLLGGSSALAARDPSPPAPGTLLLAYHPLPRGWAAFAADSRGETVRRIEDLPRDDRQLSALLLAPFAEQIARAEVIEVISYGDLRKVHFHALPFAGGILLDRATVVYRLDLPDSPVASSPRMRAALVVSAPGLLQAPAEARRVRDVLETRDLQVDLREEATHRDVWENLPRVDLFHYAGHAEFDDQSRGWDSHLALAGGTRWTVDDILALDRVPHWVVLSGCETGLDDRQAPLPTIGLAQAFLVAGAQGVVAATAKVSDGTAAALSEALYRHWDASTGLSTALRKAQLELEEGDPRSGWQEFRVIVR